MESDAKLGLLAGLAGVVAVAVVYFQKPTEDGVAANVTESAAVSGPAPIPGLSAKGEKPQPIAKPTSYVKPRPESER